MEHSTNTVLAKEGCDLWVSSSSSGAKKETEQVSTIRAFFPSLLPAVHWLHLQSALSFLIIINQDDCSWAKWYPENSWLAFLSTRRHTLFVSTVQTEKTRKSYASKRCNYQKSFSSHLMHRSKWFFSELHQQQHHLSPRTWHCALFVLFVWRFN